MLQGKKEIVTDVLNQKDEPMVMLFNLAKECGSLPQEYSFVETGTRSGHASILMLKAIKETNNNRWLFTIDPYGNKPYGHGKDIYTNFDYGEQHYRNAQYSLSKYAFDNDLLHYHYRLKSEEFEKVKSLTEFWHNGGKVEPKYGFIYLDGEHTTKAVLKELEYFLPRMHPEGGIVIDDVSLIDVDALPIKGEVKHDKLFVKLCQKN